MALITKPDMEFIWASGGAIVEPSDVKKQTGWTPEVPPHQWENWVQNRQDQYIAHVNQRGIPVWDGNTEYEAGGLSYTQGSDGKIYKSVAASGPSSTSQDPTTDVTDTYWKVAFADVGAFLTQIAGDARYAQRTNNLSDLSNAATARTNLGLSDTVSAGISGSHSNLKASATGLSAIVTITADSVCLKNASNAQVVVNSVSVTPSIASAGANGLDTGTSAINTQYYTWIIWNGTTISGLISLSSTSPTMPSGYTHKARVGSFRTDGTGNKYPLSFVQAGDLIRYKPAAGSNLLAPIALISGVQGNVSTPTWVSTSLSSAIPPTASAVQLTLVQQSGASATAMAAPSAAFGAHSSLTNTPPFAVSGNTGNAVSLTGWVVLETMNFYFASNNAASSLLLLGYEDNL